LVENVWIWDLAKMKALDNGESMGAMIAGFIIRQSNRLGRVRDAVYLDTNAWSTLAKQEAPYEPLRDWVLERGYYIWMARFQVAELTGDTRLARPLAELARKLPVVLIDRGQNELQGDPWYKVKTDLEYPLRLDSDNSVDEFVDQIMTGPIREARQQLTRDAESFRTWLARSISSIPNDVPRDWSSFPRRLESWIRSQCERNGVEIREDALTNPQCYISLRLSYAVLFARYFTSRDRWKRWEHSEYNDYLHAFDMAYAGTVITERSLAECIRQAARRPELTAPHTILDLRGLKAFQATNSVASNG
jgi:hypothetical protein